MSISLYPRVSDSDSDSCVYDNDRDVRILVAAADPDLQLRIAQQISAMLKAEEPRR